MKHNLGADILNFRGRVLLKGTKACFARKLNNAVCKLIREGNLPV